jgi:hypothetical protein
MALDRVQPLKLEDPATGGDEIDAFPTSIDRNEDYIDSRGLAIQDPTSNDETTVVGRLGNDMIFKDRNNPLYVTLTQLLEQGSGGVADDVKRLLINTTGHVLHNTTGELVLKVGP